MRNKKDLIKNIIVFILLIIVTFYVIFSKYSIKTIIDTISEINFIYIFIGLMLMFSYFLTESINIKYLLSKLGTKVKVVSCLKYTIIGFLFSGITPATSGGQPMQAYTMYKDKIPLSHTTLALLIELCLYHLITISSGIIGAIVNYKILKDGYIYVFIVGSSLNIIVFTALIIGLFFPKLAKKIIYGILKLLKKLKINKINEKQDKIDKLLDDYQRGSSFIKKNKIILLKSFLLVLLQVISLHSIPFMVYKSFDLNTYTYLRLLSIQAMLFISVSSIPIPGSIGVSEGALFKIYSNIFSVSKLASAVLLIRITNFYFFILIGPIVYLFNSIKRKES